MKTTNWINLLIFLLLLAVVRLYTPLAIDRHYGLDKVDSPIEIEKPLEGEFDALPAILEAIAFCESGNRQFNSDGLVLRGRVNPYDAGKFPINTLYHGRRAQELGIDLYTEAGNTEFALLLFEEQGTQPWKASAKCWA